MTLDLRRIRVGIEILGQIQFYEGLRVKATGTKYANPTQNDCSVTISGLKQATRDYLLTDTSPFNDNPTPKRIILEVGRESMGVFRLFVGDIVSAEPGPPPDLDITLKAKTQSAQAGNIISTSSAATSKLSDLSAKVANDLGLSLDFQAQDKNVSNYQHTVAALRPTRQTWRMAAFTKSRSHLQRHSPSTTRQTCRLATRFRLRSRTATAPRPYRLPLAQTMWAVLFLRSLRQTPVFSRSA